MTHNSRQADTSASQPLTNTTYTSTPPDPNEAAYVAHRATRTRARDTSTVDSTETCATTNTEQQHTRIIVTNAHAHTTSSDTTHHSTHSADENRFYSRIRARDDDDCLAWTGPCKNGYPITRWAGVDTSAVRVAFLITFGVTLPKNVRIRRRCATPEDLHRWCVAPWHLNLTGNPEALGQVLTAITPTSKPTWLMDAASPDDLTTIHNPSTTEEN